MLDANLDLRQKTGEKIYFRHSFIGVRKYFIEDEEFDDLVGNKLGISCSIGKETCSITYSRIWKGHSIALEIKRILEAKDKVFTVYCQIEGGEVNRVQIIEFCQ